MNPPRKRPRFLRLAIVLACLAIEAVVLLPLGNFGRKLDFVLHAVTLTNLKVVGQAMELYCADFDDRFPPGMSSAGQAEPYLAKFLKSGTPLLALNPESAQFLGNEPWHAGSSANFLSPTTL